MFIHTQYKILLLDLDGVRTTIPTINGSHYYTLWVLRHKYLDVKLFGIVKVKYSDYIDKMFMENLWGLYAVNQINYTVPDTNPLINIESIQEVLLVLGADAVTILHGDCYEELLNIIASDLSLIHTNTANMFYNNYVVTLQINTKKVHGTSPKLNNIEFYKYTSRKRKTFNRYAEIMRKLLRKDTNRRKKYENKQMVTTLTPIMRDYYESQLQDFVYTYIYKGKTHE